MSDTDTSWRDAQLRVTIFGLDKFVLVPVFLLFFFWSTVWCWVLFFGTIVLLWWFKRMEVPVTAGFRLFRSWVAGSRRPNVSLLRKRRKT